jgi:hypothetical protein
MEIKLNTNIDSVARVSNTYPKAARAIDRDSGVSSFENSRALETQLNQIPDARAGKVDEARKLASDPAYPPRETIRKIAALLAIHDPQNTSDE